MDVVRGSDRMDRLRLVSRSPRRSDASACSWMLGPLGSLASRIVTPPLPLPLPDRARRQYNHGISRMCTRGRHVQLSAIGIVHARAPAAAGLLRSLTRLLCPRRASSSLISHLPAGSLIRAHLPTAAVQPPTPLPSLTQPTSRTHTRSQLLPPLATRLQPDSTPTAASIHSIHQPSPLCPP